MPLNTHVGYIQPASHSSYSIPSSPFDEISRELSDSVQAMVQTLLHLSPPHILDPVKELFSACTVQLPTPSVSALLTTMKNLNYLSANLKVLAPEAQSRAHHNDGLAKECDIVLGSFDIGEVVQGVGDVLAGLAAQAGVDLAIFHGDVGMRHIDVIGDEQSILFILTHITRQILATARPGDAIEIGLHLAPLVQRAAQAEDPLDTAPGEIVTPNLVEAGTPISCTFEITHKLKTLAEGANASPRRTPKLDTIVIERLLARISTSLIVNPPLTTSLVCDTTYTLATQLVGGPTPQHNPTPPSLFFEDDDINGTSSMPARDLPLAKEPTLEELVIFSDASLRGKRAVFHAQESSTFARHLTSYLTSWGLDVGHMPISGSVADNAGHALHGAAKWVDEADGQNGVMDMPGTTPPTGAPTNGNEPSFVIIDDDVDVLRRLLNRYLPEVSPIERPSLAQNHRPRSSPQIRQVLGINANEKRPGNPRHMREAGGSIIVHITSLAKYKPVKDTVQSALCLIPQSRTPDILVIPKPAGPRRLLTALYSVVRRPLVEPYFLPIANSPQSPGAVSQVLDNMSTTSDPRSGTATSPATTRSSQQTSNSPGEWAVFGNTSPRERASPSTVNSSHPGTPQTSPASATDSLGYFAPTSVKMGSSAASGVMLQSPDGRPTGIYFQPHRGSTVRASESSVGTPITRSSRPHITDTRSSSRYPPGGSSSRFIEENRSVSLRDRRNWSEPSAPGAAPNRSRPHASEDDPIFTLASSVRSTRSRHGSSRSRPTSAGSSRDASSPSQPNVPAARASTPSRHPSSRQMPDDNVLTSPANASAGVPTPSVSPPMGPKFRPIGAPVSVKNQSPPAAHAPTAEIAAPTPTGSVASAAAPAPLKILTKQKKATGSRAPKGTKASNGITPPISVLIAEDNPINQTILTTFMRRRRLKYATANNGAEAVEKWRSGQYHLILMDIQMPLMDGIDATKEIRRLERSVAAALNDNDEVVAQGNNTVPSTPFHASVIIVALTASSLQSDRVKALAAGCNDFLTKPVSLHWLDKKIIEWGSIKALQMWASPGLACGVREAQDARANAIDLHLPQQLPIQSSAAAREVSQMHGPAHQHEV